MSRWGRLHIVTLSSEQDIARGCGCPAARVQDLAGALGEGGGGFAYLSGTLPVSPVLLRLKKHMLRVF